MDYLQWNDILVEYFFNEEKAYKDVILYVNKEVIEKVGQEQGVGLEDFINAIKAGPPGEADGGICQHAFDLYVDWRKTERVLPPYVAYLSFFVLVAATELGEFAPNAYYPKFWKLLGYSDERSRPTLFDQMYLLWEDLETWSREDRAEELGVFTLRIRGGWRHVGIPSFETLFSNLELSLLPNLFNDAGLDPLDVPAPEVILSLIEKYGNELFRSRTIKMLHDTSEEASVFRSALANLILEQLENWDGSFTQPAIGGKGMQEQVRAGLRICINVDFLSGLVKGYVRFRSKRTIPEEGLSLVRTKTGEKYNCSGYTNGWSTQLVKEGMRQERLNAGDLDWKSGELFEDEMGEWQTTLRAASTRVFREGLDNLRDWVEVQRVERGPRYLVASVGLDSEKIEAWGPVASYEFECLDFEGLPNGWKLYECQNIKESCPGINLLTVSSYARLNLVGGLKSGRRNSYFDFARPRIKIENGTGEEVIKVDGLELGKRNIDGEWLLPESVGIGRPLSIEAALGDELIGKRFVRLESFESLPDLSGTPFRNSAGEISPQSADEPFAKGAIVLGMEAPENFEIQLPFHLSDRIVFIGSTPGQIADWPSEDVPCDWEPVWAIAHLRKERWKAHYCGKSIERPCMSQSELREYDRKSKRRWKEATHVRRKVTECPTLGILKELWRRYLECGQSVQ